MRLNPVLESLTPYRAGPPLEDIRRRYHLERVSRLSANESPWGPFPEVVEAMKGALDGLNRYPDGACNEVRGLLGERLNVAEDRLTFGNGSCELLMLLGEAFLGPGRHVVLPHPSFVMYRPSPSPAGPRSRRWSFPTWTTTSRPCWRPYARRYDPSYHLQSQQPHREPRAGTRVAGLPGAGPGPRRRGPRRGLRRVRLPGKAGRFGRLAGEFPNLIILRTFSKIFGLAGLRVGYGVADPQVVQALDKVRQPFNVDSLAQVAAATSLRLPERIAERRRMVAGERTRIEKRLQGIGVVYHPSEANFILFDVTQLGIPGTEVAQALLEKGVFTRSGYAMECPGWIRVTIGEAGENDMFLEALAALRGLHATPPPRAVDDLSAEALSPES